MKAARAAWNFTGYVTSDSDSVADAVSPHHYAKTKAMASCLAIKDGGCDVDHWPITAKWQAGAYHEECCYDLGDHQLSRTELRQDL